MISNRLASRRSGEWLSVILLAFIVSVLMSVAMAGDVPTTDRQPATAEQRARVLEAFGRSPLHFEPNQGQAAADVRFVARAPGYRVYLTGNEAVLASPGAAEAALLRLRLIGATVNPEPVVEGLAALPGRSHYYRGNDPAQWATDVPHFAKVRFGAVYPGVDWVLYGHPRQLQYDFVVAPGVDPAVIQLSLAGAEHVRLTEDGQLVATVAGREVLHSAPLIYQEAAGDRQVIEGRYVLREPVGDAPVVGFEVAAYDRERPLVIDPVVYFTFVGGKPDDSSDVGGDDRGLGVAGGGAFDVGYGIAVDSVGNAYITGSTNSGDFPGVTNALRGTQDAFVTKINANDQLGPSTYLGGTGNEAGYGIAVNTLGETYVTGYTTSADFPNAVGGPPSGEDAFIVRIAANGQSLVYSRLTGFPGNDRG